MAKSIWRKKGQMLWSCDDEGSDMLKVVKWTNGMCISNLGSHLLRRRRGTPMGGSLSGGKAHVVACAKEGRWLQRRKQLVAKNFLKNAQEDPLMVIGGVRYADDTLFGSRECCGECVT